MLKVKSGGLEHLGLLYKRYSRRLFGFFYRLTKDAGISEDLVQNVFERVLKYKHTYADTGNFETWIFHISRNVHLDHIRKNKRYHYQEDMQVWEGHLKEESNKEYDLQKGDELRNLTMALNALSTEKRELIEMTRFQKLKYEQVAGLLNITESAVKVRIHRIMKELKQNYLKLDA